MSYIKLTDVTKLKYYSAFSGIVLLTLFSIGVNGCSSSNSAKPAFDSSSIPDTAFEVHLYSERDPDDYIGYIRRRLEWIGFSIGDYDPVNRTVRTLSMDVGRQTSLTIFASTDYDVNVSRTIARFSGLVGDERGIARWNSSDDEQALAFKALAEYVQKIEHEHLVYAVQQ